MVYLWEGEKKVHKIVQQSSKYKKEEIESGVSMRAGAEDQKWVEKREKIKYLSLHEE